MHKKAPACNGSFSLRLDHSQNTITLILIQGNLYPVILQQGWLTEINDAVTDEVVTHAADLCRNIAAEQLAESCRDEEISVRTCVFAVFMEQVNLRLFCQDFLPMSADRSQQSPLFLRQFFASVDHFLLIFRETFLCPCHVNHGFHAAAMTEVDNLCADTQCRFDRWVWMCRLLNQLWRSSLLNRCVML